MELPAEERPAEAVSELLEVESSSCTEEVQPGMLPPRCPYLFPYCLRTKDLLPSTLLFYSNSGLSLSCVHDDLKCIFT